jgi:hypothetical protein
MFTIVLLLTLVLVVSHNLWVWFWPKSYIAYMRGVEKSKLTSSSQKEFLLKYLRSPGFIWRPRAVFGVALFVLIYMLIY